MGRTSRFLIAGSMSTITGTLRPTSHCHDCRLDDTSRWRHHFRCALDSRECPVDDNYRAADRCDWLKQMTARCLSEKGSAYMPRAIWNGSVLAEGNHYFPEESLK